MSLLVYPGSKRKHIRELLPLIPPGTKTIVSPFFGGGSFEFYLARHGYKVVAGDSFTDLVNFWKCVKNHPKELADTIIQFVPMSEAKFHELLEWLRDRQATKKKTLVDAAIFYVLNRCSFGGKNGSVSREHLNGFNKNHAKLIRAVEEFEWPKNLSLQHCDYRQLLNKYPHTFAFCDPPYLLKVDNLYGLRGEQHKAFNHEEFARRMMARKSQWMITYNEHPQIMDWFKSYPAIRLSESTGFKRTSESKMYFGHVAVIKN